jgi:hypothetical protein
MNRYLAISLSILLILVFGYNLIRHSLNIPTFDDYDATLGFIKNFYFDKASLLQKLKLLFTFHNDHCIVISRASAVMYYNFFKELNFAHLVIYQNLFLMAFFIVVLAIMRQQNLLSAYTVLFATIFLFNLSLWQVMLNYWGGIQTYTVFLFSFLSLFLLNKSQKPKDISFILAVFCVLLALFSFGNGVLVLFLGSFLLWVQKKYAAWCVWSIVSAGLLGFVLFWRIQSHVPASETFRFDWMGRLLLTFSGSFLFVNPSGDFMRYVNIIFCMVVGAAVLLFWIWLVFKKYPFKNPLLYTLFSLPLLTGILIAVTRFSTKAAGGIAPRYMFFTATIPILLVLILLDLGILNKRSVKYLVVAAMVVWGVSFYYNGIALKTYQTELISVIRKWEKDDKTPLVYYHEPQHYSRILHWAIREKVVSVSGLTEDDESGIKIP